MTAASSGGEETSPSPSAPALVRVEHLFKRYDQKTVLDDVNLAIERGETLVIIGPSGCGKTTLARHLVALERPTSGRVLFDGEDLSAMDDYALSVVRRRLSMVFQRDALLDSLTVFDNVAFPLREQRHLSDEEIRARVMASLAELGVEGAAAKMPAQISGGMAKRVGIARALVTDPEFVVYDEPTSGLDPINARVVDALVEKMRERFAVTSVVITHDMATAFEIADRVAVLAGGRVALSGTPAEVFASEREEVRRFVQASAVEPELLGTRAARKSPEQIRAQWERMKRARE